MNMSYNQMKIAADARRDDLLREAKQETPSNRGWLEALLHGRTEVSEDFEMAETDRQPKVQSRLRGVIVPR
jgi:hypothetical protein